MRRLIQPSTKNVVTVSDESASALMNQGYKDVEPEAVEEVTPTAPAPSESKPKPRTTRSRKAKSTTD